MTKNRSFPKSLVSDVFEAIVAAIHLDGGRDVVTMRLRTWLAEEVRQAVESQGSSNYKSSLQQYAQREIGRTPVYKLVEEFGPDHRKEFLITAMIGDTKYPPAWGTNKKDAEQRAAANALAEMQDAPLPYEQNKTSPPQAVAEPENNEPDTAIEPDAAIEPDGTIEPDANSDEPGSEAEPDKEAF